MVLFCAAIKIQFLSKGFAFATMSWCSFVRLFQFVYLNTHKVAFLPIYVTREFLWRFFLQLSLLLQTAAISLFSLFIIYTSSHRMDVFMLSSLTEYHIITS